METIDTRIYDEPFLLAKIFEHTELNKDEKERLYKHFEKRKRGRWVRIEDENGDFLCWECSECRERYVMQYHRASYCPNCGAETRGEEG